jgi:uncharacterized membrane protein YphA (DoxX/SURF4 family)
MSARSLSILQLLARVVLAGVFLVAAASKLADPSALAESIANYRVLPEAAVGAVALLVPAAEVVIGAALLAGPYVQGAGVLGALMLLVFAGAMAQAKVRGIDLDCGCFGAASDAQVSWPKVAMNVVGACAALWVAFRPRARWSALFPPTGSSASTGQVQG